MNDNKYISNKVSMNKEQVFRAIVTVEQWNHTQRCGFIERLLPICNSYQLDMLWTVLQPSLHRDYYYAVKSRFPNYHFKQISTPNSRIFKVCEKNTKIFCFDFILIYLYKQKNTKE
ncbi:unnamed protein product [Adineta steineri]|uniref:Uncharacterized protein n=2 Tax=Adineta steineri TaxID=433720 RepID=A0A818XYH0_9BILA|nr:unnamed protein product [Adineta steineri]CAF3745887.1 unnamed protein product [Adineta steineri]